MRRVLVRYVLGSYSGTHVMVVGDDEDNEVVFARCRRQLERGVPLGVSASFFRIVQSEPVSDES